MVSVLAEKRMEDGKKNTCGKSGTLAQASGTEKHDIRFYRVKGHVNPDSPNAGLNGLYRKFTEWNGKQFSMDDFIYITRMNNRADELANEGMAPYKPKI